MLHTALIDLKEMFLNTGFARIEWQMCVMWVVVATLLYLAISKGFEPLLLVPISLGALLANLPAYEMMVQAPVAGQPGGLFWYLAQQTLWFRAKLGIGLALAAANAVGATLVAVVLIILTALVTTTALNGGHLT